METRWFDFDAFYNLTRHHIQVLFHISNQPAKEKLFVISAQSPA